MEILKVGDTFSILGYQPITLSEDMEQNISKFASVNGIDTTEAQRILSTNSALKDFIASLNTTDDEEDIVITDFNLDDITEMTKTSASNNINPLTKTAATAPAANGIIFASSSTNNSNDLKNLLGIFGFSAAQQVDRELKTQDKTTGFVINNVRYEATFDSATGIVRTTITKPNGEVTTGEYPPPDPLIQKRQNSINRIIELIRPLIANASKVFRNEEFIILKNAINEVLKDYNAGNSTSNIAHTVIVAISQVGFNVKYLTNALDKNTTTGNNIEQEFQNFATLNAEKQEKERIEALHTNKTQTVNGITFKIRYLTNSTNYCNITTANDGSIVIDGKNCEVNLMGFGSSDKEIKVTGDNVTLNCNAFTVEKITNSSKNSTIAGSFGNDNIVNRTDASNTTINSGDGDDQIWNYAQGTTLNGDKGNDTVVNYGSDTTINGGDNDDAINYVENSATITASEGNDIHNLIDSRVESDDPAYKFAKKYFIGGLTFIAYSNTDDFSNLTATFYKKLITISATDMKIKVTGGNSELSVDLKGSSLKYVSSVQLKAVFNHAENSTITGTEKDDFLYNYSEGSTVEGKGGDDTIKNEGDNSKIDGGSGKDIVYNTEEADNTDITTDGQDKVYNGNSTSNVTLTKGNMTTQEYNMSVNMAYIESTLNGTNLPSMPDATSTIKSNARSLANKLVTTNSAGKKVYSELAQKLINYARGLSSAVGIIENMKSLEIGLKDLDANKNGDITDTELAELDKNLEEIESKKNEEAKLRSIKTNIKSELGLSDSELTNFLKSYNTTAKALEILNQIQAIINTIKSNAQNVSESIANIKEMMTSETHNFNNEILADAQILVEASQQENPHAYIKSKMIKDGSDKTLAQLASSTTAGEVVEKDGKLYVNDSGTMVELDISADTYLELFPPVSRYFIEQEDYESCFFLATTAISGMENGKTKAKLLQLFSENTSGDITVTFPGLSSYPVKFEDGELKLTDGIYKRNDTTQTSNYNNATTACLGLSMLEQAYALAKFAQISNSNLSYESIESTFSEKLADDIESQKNVTDTSSIDMDKALSFYVTGGYAITAICDIYGSSVTIPEEQYTTFEGKSNSFLESTMSSVYANSSNNNGMLVTLIADATISATDKEKYDLANGHQYSIESINPSKQTVTIKNPWHPYKTTEIPYSVFFKYFHGIMNVAVK